MCGQWCDWEPRSPAVTRPTAHKHVGVGPPAGVRSWIMDHGWSLFVFCSEHVFSTMQAKLLGYFFTPLSPFRRTLRHGFAASILFF